MTPLQRSEHWELHRTEDRLHKAEAARDRYRLAARALTKAVLSETPDGYSVADAVEIWGDVYEEIPPEELAALREVEKELES